MSKNRAGAEAFILKYIEKILPGGGNGTIYKNLFANMDDEEFDAFMMKIKKGETRLAIIAPNLAKVKLSTERNLDIAEELQHNFFEHIWIDRGDETPRYLSGKKYLIVDLPLRRQAQLLVKKISIPKSNRTVDDLTGQPTGESKGSKVSYPEVQILAALGLTESLTEMLKYRGGDVKGYDAMSTSISKTGGVSMKSIAKLGTVVKSTQTLATFLMSMHLESTLL